jgi:hypothetical protein
MALTPEKRKLKTKKALDPGNHVEVVMAWYERLCSWGHLASPLK